MRSHERAWSYFWLVAFVVVMALAVAGVVGGLAELLDWWLR